MRFLSQIPPSELAGKKVLLRADFNVPLVKGKIGDDTRIRQTLPTIHYILEAGGSVVICSHLGRPEGKPNSEYSLFPVAEHLEKVLRKPVAFFSNPLEVKSLKPGNVILLQNTRFFEEETANSTLFAAALACGCNFFVNDAFGSVHRAHASTVAVAGLLPSAAGLLLEKEITILGEVLNNPSRPLVILAGGAKMKDKIGVLEHFAEIADSILLGGGIANTFLAATGKNIGDSLFEPSEIGTAQRILAKAIENDCEIMLPKDAIISLEASETAVTRVKSIDWVVGGEKILDLGPKSAEEYSEKIKGAQMFVWNGPVGIFELSPFSNGTRAIAEAAKNCPGKTILGGGDTIDAISRFGFFEGSFSHLSTGGGAMLEFLEGKVLPGIEALQNSPTQ